MGDIAGLDVDVGFVDEGIEILGARSSYVCLTYNSGAIIDCNVS